MFGLSIGEIIFLGALGLIVIGPKQLPEVARTIGRFLNELKRATDGLTQDFRQSTRIDFDLHNRNPPPALPPQPPASPAAEATPNPEKKDDSDSGKPT
ncbi:MAG: twin-arginine translocase TatA/TatE family subunit [Bdellovibrionaceae bacterium]|nr:twin-arginine translocase TatA/TatE family subunit [Pseudobdellovibrionaceae bacterium]